MRKGSKNLRKTPSSVVIHKTVIKEGQTKPKGHFPLFFRHLAHTSNEYT